VRPARPYLVALPPLGDEVRVGHFDAQGFDGAS
jgi:hypothetical protein